MLPVKLILLIVALLLSQPTPEKDRVWSYLALGDSYTIGESVDAPARYPFQAVQLLHSSGHLNGKVPDIIATTGWTTANLLDAISAASPSHTYNIVTLLIGVNNEFQGGSQSQYRDEFTLLLQQSIALAGNQPSHVLVLSIPDYSVTPFGRTRDTAMIATQIDSFNHINYGVAMEYKVRYLDITGESRKALSDPSLVAEDGLHFSGKEYGIWAARMAPVMKEMLR
jgi:lysophospholipase L1-like esterase